MEKADGFVNPSQPELSGIVLSLVNKEGQQIPGHLRLADLFEQDFLNFNNNFCFNILAS
ncbi:MAG: hypothetical protein AAGG00_18915 [Cyanobacteria bacterium P01_H01_bin.150]